MRICVYAGSNPGTNPAYGDAAERLGRAGGNGPALHFDLAGDCWDDRYIM